MTPAAAALAWGYKSVAGAASATVAMGSDSC